MKWTFLIYENNSAAVLLEYFYDDGVVRAFEVQEHAADPGELGDCVLRVLLPGAGKSIWLWGVHSISIEDHSGSDYAGRIYCVCVALFWRGAEVKLRGVVAVYPGGRGVCVLGQAVTGWKGFAPRLRKCPIPQMPQNL